MGMWVRMRMRVGMRVWLGLLVGMGLTVLWWVRMTPGMAMHVQLPRAGIKVRHQRVIGDRCARSAVVIADRGQRWWCSQ